MGLDYKCQPTDDLDLENSVSAVHESGLQPKQCAQQIYAPHQCVSLQRGRPRVESHAHGQSCHRAQHVGDTLDAGLPFG